MCYKGKKGTIYWKSGDLLAVFKKDSCHKMVRKFDNVSSFHWLSETKISINDNYKDYGRLIEVLCLNLEI